MMQKARIKCPKCGTLLEVENPTGELQKTVECMSCKARLIVKFGRESEKTQNGSESYESMLNRRSRGKYEEEEDEEEFGTSIMSGIADTTIGKLKYQSDLYTLQMGINTIGRMASTSKASEQIATPDRSMSRLHSVIEVSRMFDGSVRAIIRNADNKNRTFVGGQELIDGDRIVLNYGDVIRMGDVQITYIKDPKYDV
jgi:transcription elongation factor Elf1